MKDAMKTWKRIIFAADFSSLEELQKCIDN